MSTEAAPIAKRPAPVEQPLSMQELASVLVKHYGLREGKFDLMIEFQFGAGAVGPDKDKILPGVMIGIAKVGLVPATKDSPMTVDAAAANPVPRARRKG